MNSPHPPCQSHRARLPSPVALAVCALLAALQGQALAQGRQDTLVLSGQAAPGAGAGTFSGFSAPVVNDFGQISFFANMSGGSSASGIFRSGAAGALTPIALQGQSATGAGAGTFSSLGQPALNNAGQVAFFAFISGGSSTGGNYRSSSGSALTAIALQGQSAPLAGGSFSGFSSPVLNDTGQMAFRGQITGGSSSAGIYRSSAGGSLTSIALQGASAPGVGSGTFSILETPVLNSAGQVAFLAAIAGGSSTGGLFRSSGSIAPVALNGQAAPGTGTGTFSGFVAPALSDAGQVAFRAFVVGGSSTQGIYRSGSGSTPTALALQGQSAAGTATGTFSFFSTPMINDAGQTAFTAEITGGSSTSGVYRSSSGSALTAIALQGQGAVGSGPGTFSSFSTPLQFNDGGLVAFRAGISGGISEVGSSTSLGLYLADGRDTVNVQLQGNSLAGRIVLDQSITSSRALNRHGQLAYRASFTDGTQGTFLFTPALRWRETFSSNWDTADRWTLGITPGSVHDVSIDPSVALTVTGPAGGVNLRSLTVGGGTGFATLNLGGGSLTSASAVQVASRGILTGSGTVVTQVANAGEVRADSLILSGGLLNSGTLRGMATGNQRIDTNLTNNAGGVVRVDAGERLRLAGTAHSNSGQFELRGGEMQISGATTNQTAGRMLFNGNGGIARFNNGLTNNGQVQVSFGSAELFGAVTTTAGGRIILTGNSNTAFYDAVDIRSGGELRISTGSNAVFFGQVFQRTGSLFTGAGAKFYEGGLSVGASPGLGMDGGDVNFGAGNAYLAEIGGTELGDAFGNGLAFDRYMVAGTLTLGGTLRLVSWDSFVGQAGQSFDLFDWGTLAGSFDHIDSSGFVLAAGTTLDFSSLYTDGTVRVASVPEPETYALLLMGLGLVGVAVRRQRARRA